MARVHFDRLSQMEGRWVEQRSGPFTLSPFEGLAVWFSRSRLRVGLFEICENRTGKSACATCSETANRLGRLCHSFGLHAHIGEFLKTQVEGRDWDFCGGGRGSDQAIHKMDFCAAIEVERIEMNRGVVDFNAGTRNECAERRGDIAPRTLLERFEDKDALDLECSGTHRSRG